MINNQEHQHNQKPKRLYSFTVYGLQDPRDNKIFYVGRSKHPNARLLSHLAEAERYKQAVEHPLKRLFGVNIASDDLTQAPTNINRAKVNIINAIQNAGFQVQLKIIDVWETDDLQDANRLEEAWIAHHFLTGHPLTNKITSSRMRPSWYSPKSKNWKPWYAESPMEYIKKLKNGELPKTEREQHSIHYYRRRSRRLNNPAKAQTKKRIPGRKSGYKKRKKR